MGAEMMRVLAVATVALSLSVHAQQERYEEAKNVDPGKLCAQAQKRFPGSLQGVRALDSVLSEKVRPDQDYCSADLSQCEIRDIAFPGLEASLLVKKATGETGILMLTISDAKWKTLQPLGVGAQLSMAERYLGVKAQPAASVLKVIGECTPIDVHHANGRVTKLRLDCQACI